MDSNQGQLKLLITGGCGFIGSNFIRLMLKKYPGFKITNLDKLTYAGNPMNTADYNKNRNYSFVKGDVCDEKLVSELVSGADIVVNFAAETHVDRSIGEPDSFIKTDVFGTYNILDAIRKFDRRMVQISTDEVYGSVSQGESKETDPFNPSSPYSSSKASADLLTLSYHKTYGTNVVVTRSSNNYGPYQYPEKLIPLFVTNAIEGKSLPVYGNGKQMRDWLYVLDNCEAIELVMLKGERGQAYNIGAGCEQENIFVTETILRLLGKDKNLIAHVQDRPGHDIRYSIDTKKIIELGWKPNTDFATGMKLTVEWYKNNANWWKPLKSGEFLKYYRAQYSQRLNIK